MSKPKVRFVRGRFTAVLSTEFTCSVCGEIEQGDMVVLRDFNFDTPEEIGEVLEGASASSRSMPAGWSYTGVYKCPKCKH